MIQSEPRVVCEVIGEANERTENDFPGSIEPTPTLVDDMATKIQDQSSLLPGILYQSKPDYKGLLPNDTVSNT